MIRRRTQWFMLAFGGWGRCLAPEGYKSLLAGMTSVGQWWRPTIAGDAHDDEDTDPG